MWPIYLVQFESSYRMSATFMRFQEFYESPKFQGKEFSWEEFMDWYAEKNKRFSYFDDYSGFNIPGSVLGGFRKGRFQPLIKKEREFLKLFDLVEGDFYIIGAKRGKINTIRHEIVHGLYYINLLYRKAVSRCVKRFDTTKIRRALRKIGGYHPNHFVDEINAYVLTGIKSLSEIKKDDVHDLKKALRKVFEEHFGFNIKTVNAQFLLNQLHIINM